MVHHKAKILIIDDEKDLVSLIRARLEESDYNVIFAFSGLEGLDKAGQEPPDLILLDIMMPGMDGYEVLNRLKNDEKTSRIPVIMLTGKGELKSIFEAQQLRAIDYIIKPIDIKLLLKLIKRYAM